MFSLTPQRKSTPHGDAVDTCEPVALLSDPVELAITARVICLFIFRTQMIPGTKYCDVLGLRNYY